MGPSGRRDSSESFDRITKFLQQFLPTMGETTRVTNKGQTTIPKELRERYGIEPGDTVEWIETEDGLAVKKRSQLGGYGSFAGEADENDRERLADALEGDLYESRRTEWSIE